MLAKSLKLLFAKTKGSIAFVHGKKWFDEGYWKIASPYNDDLRTVSQYLVAPLDEMIVSFDEFIKGDFDVLMATYHDHVKVYDQLIKKYNLKTKLVYQMGNEWPVDWSIVNNLMASTKKFPYPQGKNVVFYHQEIDLNIFEFEPPDNSKFIRSFVHCLPTQHKEDWKDFKALEKQLDYKFESYGSGCREGVIREQKNIAELMTKSKFGLHFKSGGDGFGHVIYDWFLTGRPVIYKGSQYKDKLANELLIDGVTGFDFERGNVVQRIKKLTDESYKTMCINAHNQFVKVVDYNKELQDLRKFFKNLI